MKDRTVLLLAILNLVGFAGTVVVNALANIIPINNITTGEVSDLYPNLFTPAGLTFSIWGLIYLLLGIFAVYQLMPSFRRDPQKAELIHKIGPLFFISCLANSGWIFAWHYQSIGLSLVLMLALLASLLAIYLRLGIGRAELSRAGRYLVHLPFSIYLGWITVATIANVTIMLVDVNWGALGLGAHFWAAAVIVVGTMIGLSVLFTRKDAYYALVVDWALLGILLKRLTDETAADQTVVYVTIAGLAVLTVGIIVQAVRRRAY
ncbi:MAG: tryptophan-rich sensory protein [Dehalococcoidia bacterium]